MRPPAQPHKFAVSRGAYLRRRLNWLLGAVLLIGPAGCSQREPLARVSGQVTYEGQPVEEGLILFSSAALGIHITADIHQGRYEVVTSRADGLPPGEYEVAIAPPVADPPIGPIAEPPQAVVPPDIPERYHDARTSGLVARLVDGDNTASFDMKKIGQ
jgi:hypothetical protein